MVVVIDKKEREALVRVWRKRNRLGMVGGKTENEMPRDGRSSLASTSQNAATQGLGLRSRIVPSYMKDIEVRFESSTRGTGHEPSADTKH